MPHHYTLDNGNEVALLDVIEVEVSSPKPEPHQPENWVLGGARWRLVARVETSAAMDMLKPYLVVGPDLLGNQSDRIDFAILDDAPAPASLALIEPSSISWQIRESFRGNRQTRAAFQLGGRSYSLSVTDPRWEQRLSRLSYGTHRREAAGIAPQDRVLFTVSLGEPLNMECFKLVAAIIVLPGTNTTGRLI